MTGAARMPPSLRPIAPHLALGLLLLGAVLWMRWPTVDFSLWNVDEAIHAAAARTILDGGVLYRDAIDQRTPLSYYAVAGIFAVFGENNLRAVRLALAGLIAATALLLFLTGKKLHSPAAGFGAATLYALLSSSALTAGDANAANTEWFVAFFSAAAAAVFLGGAAPASPRRLFFSGALLGLSFLSKQPALLDLAAPAAALAYAGWLTPGPRRDLGVRLAALVAGWLTPVLFTLGYFAAQGALADAIFYTWTYNLSYYGPEVTTAGRLGALTQPFRQIGAAAPWLLGLWVAGAALTLHRLAQRRPTPTEAPGNPGLVHLAAWSLAGLAGAAAGGRDFSHYTIQFLAPFCLGGGLALAALLSRAAAPGRARPGRLAAAALLGLIAYGLAAGIGPARERTLPPDSSLRVSAYIRAHSAPTDRIFVWGYHPDIHLFADRRPASRYLYASFVTGLIPWTNTAPDRDTAYAAVPGAMATLLRDLADRAPAFIVDCSAGPNRHWQKYPLEQFPALRDFIRRHYRVVEAGQFVPQGYRLFQRRDPAEPAENPAGPLELPAEIAATLPLGTLAAGLTPVRASAPLGTHVAMTDGRLEYFAHAPALLAYRLPAGGGALRGGYGIRPGAYAPENQGPTDGAEFIIRWRPAAGGEQVLLRRLLRPREEPADRGLHSFRVSLPPGPGEVELAITTGPADNSASDWTFWTDLMLENFR